MNAIIGMLVQALIGTLTPALLKNFADMVLDFAEDYVLGTASKVDDAIVLPLCSAIRAAFDIADND